MIRMNSYISHIVLIFLMADCLMIFGPAAVGKMTVGNEIAKITGMKLFHNHMTIEMLIRIFPHGTDEFKVLDKEFRLRIFEEMAKSEQKGIIFTFVFALDLESDWNYTHEIVDIFEKRKGKVMFVELESTQETRLQRNSTEYRLSEKPSKRDFNFSNSNLKLMDGKFKLNSNKGDKNIMIDKLENYLKINNEELEPVKVANLIIDHFNL